MRAYRDEGFIQFEGINLKVSICRLETVYTSQVQLARIIKPDLIH